MDDSRASLTEIKRAYDHFFNKEATLSKIKSAALGGGLFPSSIPSNGSIGVSGRSLAWKLFLLPHEPLETSPVRALALVETVRATREAYKALLLEKMKAPDGSYDANLVLPGSASARTGAKEWKSADNSNVIGVGTGVDAMPGTGAATNLKSDSSTNLELNNPLSLHNENPWNEWFAAVELRKTILQDVERTFPDIAYFRRPDVQLQLTNILFLFSSQHPSVGYRQGMHELLAVLYHAVAFDAIMEEQEGVAIVVDASLKELCSLSWIAADAWALFEAVMRGASRWYEWQESPMPAANGRSRNDSPLLAHVRLDVRDGQGELRPYVAPIVQTCNMIQGTLLRATDPRLYRAMQATGIEPQIYGIRWLRLLFTREFSMSDALRLWDGIFACDPTLDLAHWICVAMLIRIRSDLISTDYSGQLTLLLRYPTPPNVETSNPHHAVLLLRQALALQMAPNPSTGASVIIENKTILDMGLEIVAPAPTSPPKGHLSRHQIASAPGREGQGHGRLPSSPSMGLPEMFARGLLERGESLGINKALVGAVSELKRNIPDLAASLVRPSSHAEAAFPLEDERPAQERPPWEPRTRLEMESEISQFYARDKRLGDSLGWIVDVLLQDEEGAENSRRLKKEKREAIESLAYIRDVLISNAMELEEDRLVGEEEELRRRRTRAQRQAAGSAESSPPRAGLSKMVPPPAPLPVIDSQPKRTGHGSRQHRLAAVPQSQGQQPSAPPARAPWNYTRSSFSGGSSAVPSAAMPRLPPSLKHAGERPSDQSPPQAEGGGYGDPLGVMRM